MQFINNWSRAVTLAPGVTSLALDLPDGDYRLTLADSQFTPTRWEIVDATVAAGTATLARGLEGTSDQDWPTDSVIYCAVTAGVLTELFARISALEGGGDAPYQLMAADGGSRTGFQIGAYGALEPATISIGGVDHPIEILATAQDGTSVTLTFQIDSQVNASLRLKIDGLMPQGEEWAYLDLIFSSYSVVTIENMSAMVAGQTYGIWIEEV